MAVAVRILALHRGAICDMSAANPGVESATEKRFYPNKIARLALLSLEDMLGRDDMEALLRLAGTPHLIGNYPPNDYRLEFAFGDLSRIMAATEQLYGERGARGMQLRAGRYAFSLGLKEFGALLGASDLALKLIPLAIKAKIVLNLTARTFASYADQPTRVEERRGQFLYIIEKCPVCWERRMAAPACFIAQGILEEALRWVSGGRHFRIEEIECIGAGGSACVWAIDKQPLDELSTE